LRNPKTIAEELPDTKQALKIFIDYCMKEIKRCHSNIKKLENRIEKASEKLTTIESSMTDISLSKQQIGGIDEYK